MRRKQQQTHVRTITTGHVEADMLGQVIYGYLTTKQRGLSQRPHRTYKRVKGKPESIFRKVIEYIQTALSSVQTGAVLSMQINMVADQQVICVRIKEMINKCVWQAY